jgi:hypothetical protein
LATSGVGRPSLAEGRTCGSARGSGAAVAGMPPAAAFLRPSLLASRRSGEGPAGGGVDGIAIPGMGRRVATVEAGPADAKVKALPGSAPARSATFGWPATDSLGLPDSPNESDSLRVAWDTLARAVLGRVSASLAGPAAGGATAASGVTSTLAAGGRAAFAAGTSGPALADWGFVGPGQTFDAAGGVLVAGAGLAVVALDRVSGGATGGLGLGTGRASGAAAGATLAGPVGRASRAGGTLASAAGCALTSGPGGTWALGGGSLTSGAGGFLASPAGRAVANAFAAATVGTSAVPGPASLGPTGLAGAGPCPFAAGAFAACATGVLAASGPLAVGTGVLAASGPGLSTTGAAGASVTGCRSSTISDGAPGEVDLSCALTCCR